MLLRSMQSSFEWLELVGTSLETRFKLLLERNTPVNINWRIDRMDLGLLS